MAMAGPGTQDFCTPWLWQLHHQLPNTTKAQSHYYTRIPVTTCIFFASGKLAKACFYFFLPLPLLPNSTTMPQSVHPGQLCHSCDCGVHNVNGFSQCRPGSVEKDRYLYVYASKPKASRKYSVSEEVKRSIWINPTPSFPSLRIQ